MSLSPRPAGDPAVLSWIAARCYRELGIDQRPAKGPDPFRENREHVRLWLRRTVDTGSLDVYSRADCGDLLALLGDDRPGVLELPSSLDDEGFWTGLIEPGLFPAGERMKDGSLREHQITTPYRISRHPITNAQFQKFEDAGGYENEAYWTEAGWAWRVREEERRIQDRQPPFHDRYNSGLKELGFHLPNRPVVKVTWYEARAFCSWLSEHLGLTPGSIRLLDELEWERAARGTDGREYPWQGPWNETRCNNGQIELKRTTAVGLFLNGASPCGALDMSGNVWEWCRTLADDWKQDESGSGPLVLRGGLFRGDLGDEGLDDESGSGPRMLRGGSYRSFAPDDLLCSCREDIDPDYWLDDLGFRVLSDVSLPLEL